MKGLSFLFARRYLFSRKSHSVINIVSIVSAISISVPVMAMIILLSIFNGLEGMIESMYNVFDPDLEVRASRGKIFETDELEHKLKEVEEIAALSFVLEENVLFEYGDRQSLGVMCGVDSSYNKVIGIDTLMVSGEYRPWFGDMFQATLGRGMAYSLGVNVNIAKALNIYSVSRTEFSPLFAIKNYSSDRIFPSGIFVLDAESDSKYVFVPLEFAQNLLSQKDAATSIAISLKSTADQYVTKAKIEKLLKDDFVVLTRMEQNGDFYKIMNYEKWGVYFIILLVLIIASFSLIGSMTMLIIEKKAQMATLNAMGADISFLRSIFLREGLLIYFSGAFAGLILGILFCLAQQRWGFITISAPSILIDVYPIELRGTDILNVCLSFMLLSYLMARLTTLLTIKASDFKR